MATAGNSCDADHPFMDHHLWTRVCREFLELPGLRLTLAQAARLWHLSPAASEAVLDALVEASFLRRSGAHYVRADAGRPGA